MPRRKQGLPLLSVVGLTTQLRHRDPGSIWILPSPLWVSGLSESHSRGQLPAFCIALSGTRKARLNLRTAAHPDDTAYPSVGFLAAAA